MRCNNCGWVNEPGTSRCVKCNAPQEGSMIGDENKPVFEKSESLKETLREPDSSMKSAQGSEQKCVKCGYPLSAAMSVCPACQTKVQKEQKTAPRLAGRLGGTINTPYAPTESFFTLRRIPWPNEQITYNPESYSGDSIVLNRANTDPNNNTITSREQAVISCKNGEYFIENRSEYKTTMIRVNQSLKLEDGDVIMLGNRMFEFKKG